MGPAEGDQACGDIGLGRMFEPQEILIELAKMFSTGILAGKRILITAGPTQESIDPVRYISNKSSGKMGFAIAEAAIDAGAKVTLISGPVKLNSSESVNLIKVTSADEMYVAVMKHAFQSDIFISTAAVSDYKPKFFSQNKIKKISSKDITIELKQNIDILSSVTEKFRSLYVVGFAAETEDLENNAKKKLIAKNLNLIIANDVSNKEIGFDSDDNEVTLISANKQLIISKAQKSKVARSILEFIAEEV